MADPQQQTSTTTYPPSTNPLKRTHESMSTPTTHPAGLLAADLEMHGARTFPPSSTHGPLLTRNQPATEIQATQAAALSKSVPLQVKKLSAVARAPTRGSAFAAGYDLYAAEGGVVPARGKAMLGTGIAVAVPPGTYGRIAPRSGLASKYSIATGAGVIDYDYRGEVKILLFNHSDVDFGVAVGDRIAQLVLERIVTPDVVEVEELEGTERGEGGFGSTGGFGNGNGNGNGSGAMEGVIRNGEGEQVHGGLDVLTGGAAMNGI